MMNNRNIFFRCLLAALFALSIGMTPAVAQQLQVQVIAQPLQSPYLSDYERSPGVLTVTIVNPTQQEVRFKVDASLKLLRQNRTVANVKLPQAREFSVSANGSVTLQAPDFLDRSALNISPQDQEAVLRTNRIPEGEYELCVSVVDAQSQKPLQTATRQPVCRQFRTQTPQAPRLLSPQNAQAALQPYPQFAWTPTFFVSGRTALYVVTVCKILNGQTPRQALEGNVPLVKTDPLQGTSYSYPATAEQLDQITDAGSFVWQVQAVDENGVPIGENNGKSEIFTFLPPKGFPIKSQAAPSQTAPPATFTQSGAFPSVTISGVVTADIAGTNVPAAGVHIALQAASEQGATVGAAETDAQGRFILANIATKTDQYTIRVKSRNTEKTFPPFVLNVGERKENLTLTIELPSYQAQLMLTDTDGKPVAGAVVKVSRPSGVFVIKGEPALNLTATSNGAGLATLSGLLVSGNVQDFYVAEIAAEGYKSQRIYLQNRSTGILSEKVRLEKAGLRLFGKVLQGAATVANAAVYLLSGNKALAQSISDNDGTYTIDATANMITGLSAQAKAALRVVAARGNLRGEPLVVPIVGESVELNPTLPATATTFTGLVFTTSAGRRINLSGATVTDLATGNSTTTDGGGKFSLQASGQANSNTLLVMVSRAGFQDKEINISSQASEIALEAQGNWLQVAVLDTKTNKPISGAKIILIDSAMQATTDAVGNATLKGFPQYARSFTVYAAGYGVETLDFLPSSGLAAEPVTVRLSAGGVVTGTVKDENGKPVRSAVVSIVGYENVLAAQTDVDGTFKLDNVPVGDVRLAARAVGFVSGKSDVNIIAGKAQSVALVLKKSSSGITNIAGFEARIDAVREEGENFVVSGVLTNLKRSQLFASLVPNVNFQDVKVTKSSATTGNALPVGGKFLIVERELPMKFADEFPAKAKNTNLDAGLEIVLENPNDTQGVLKGVVQWQFAEYVSDVAAGASANIEEVQLLVAKPLFGKDGAVSYTEEHRLFSPHPNPLPREELGGGGGDMVQQSESDQYKAACQQVPSITIGGVTLAVVCDNFTVDVANKSASFGAKATLPENPLGLDTITVNPVKMSKAWGFQSAEIQFSPALSIPLASSGWKMNLQKISITSTGIKIGGSITVSVAPSIPVNGITFSDVGVALGGVSGGSFTTSPNEFDVFGITKIVAPTLTVAVAGDSITVRAANGKLSLTAADWANLTIPTFQFTRRLDSLRRKPNLPAFNATSTAVPNSSRRPSFPALGKIAASLKGIVSVELNAIAFNDQSELSIDGNVAFQFPGLSVQVGQFTFGKNTFRVGEFGFTLDAGKLYAGMKVRYTTTPKTRFEGEAKVEINKTGASSFLSLDALVMYESRTVWSVDFKVGIPPVQLVPPVPIWLSGFGGGIAQDNTVFRVSINTTLQTAPSKPAPMEATLGISVKTSGVIEGTANLLMVGEQFGSGRITLDIPQKSVSGSITIGLTKGGVTATGTTNYGVNWGSGDYFVSATASLQVPSLFTANGYFYYGVETKTVTRTYEETKVTFPTFPAGTSPTLVDQVQQSAQIIQDLDNAPSQTLQYNIKIASILVIPFTWRMNDNLSGMKFGKFTMSMAQAATDKFTTPKPNETETATACATALREIAARTSPTRQLDLPSGFSIASLLSAKPPTMPNGIYWAYAYFENGRQPNPDDIRSTYTRGEPQYNKLVSHIAYIYAQAGIKPADVKVERLTKSETTSYQDGKCQVDVTATLTNINKSIDFGIGSASFYAWANGRFKLETTKDFKTGSGSLAASGAAGFSIRVIGIGLSGDASVSANLNLNYSPTKLTFNGSVDASLQAEAGFRSCCAHCNAGCNSIDGDFICGEAKACVGVRAGFDYNGSRFSFTLDKR